MMQDIAGLISAPRAVRPRLPQVDSAIERQLKDATFSLSAQGEFSLHLSAPASDVLVLIRPESKGKVFGISIEARSAADNSEAYSLEFFELDIFRISPDSEDPSPAITRNPHQLCSGPFERDQNYIIIVPRPPTVLRMPSRPYLDSGDEAAIDSQTLRMPQRPKMGAQTPERRVAVSVSRRAG